MATPCGLDGLGLVSWERWVFVKGEPNGGDWSTIFEKRQTYLTCCQSLPAEEGQLVADASES